MADESYRFVVDPDIGEATQKLEKIKGLMDHIEGKDRKTSNNFFRASDKDMEDTIRAMKELIELSKEAGKSLGSVKSSQGSKGDFLGVQAVNKELDEMYRKLDRARNSFEHMADSRTKMSTVNRDINKEAQRHTERTGSQGTGMQANQSYYSQELRDLKDLEATEKRLRAQSDRVMRNSYAFKSRGRMTYNERETIRGDMSDLKGAYTSQAPGVKSLYESIPDNIGKLNGRIDDLNGQLRDLTKNTNIDTTSRKNMESELKQTRNILEKTVGQYQKLNETISASEKSVNIGEQNVKGTTTNPKRDSMAGIIYERAPSISMAMLGGALAPIYSLYNKGGTANASMRNPSISIGQRTGNQDYRAVRKEAQEMGLEGETNYKGSEMLEYQNQVLSGMGYKGQESFNQATQYLAEGGRSVPVDSNNLTETINGLMKQGAITNAEQVKGIQQAFLGAIKESGMVGREEETLDALKSISSSVFSGRNGNQDELNTVVAIQGMLNKSGGPSLQGEQGSQFLTSMDQGLKNSASNNMMSLIFGRGTKYQGLAGRFELEEQMEKGLGDADNVKTLMNFADQYAGPNASQEAKMQAFKSLSRQMGVSTTSDQIRGFYKATDGGKNLSDEALQKAVEQYGTAGEKERDTNLEGYRDSKEALADRSEATTEKQATGINDYGDIFRKINASLSGLAPWAYGGVSALAGAGGAISSSLGMSGISSVFKKGMQGLTSGKGLSSIFSGLGKEGGMLSTVASKGDDLLSGGSSLLKSAKNWGSQLLTGKPTMLADDALDAGSKSGFFSNLLNKAGNIGKATVDSGLADDAVTAGGGFLSKVGGFLSKGAKYGSKVGGTLSKWGGPVLATALAGFDIATSDDKTKAVGRNAGQIGGGWAGASAGASVGATIGSFIPIPGVGTGIGALLGGLIGGLGGGAIGGKLGEGVVDWGRGAWKGVKNFFGGNKKGKNGTSLSDEELEAMDVEGSGISLATMGDKEDSSGVTSGMVGSAEGTVTKGESKLGIETALAPFGIGGALVGKVLSGAGNRLFSSRSAQDRDTKGKKLNAEQLREKNVAGDKDNLSVYEKLLERASQLLTTAKAQNGIFGNSDGSTDGSSSSSGSTGTLGTVGDGTKWTNTEIKKHDLGKTVSGLTAKELDKWIDNVSPANSPMKGLGSTFLEAGKESGLDPRYLVAHSALETGWGTSALSKQGNKTTGNWFGIGAVDENPNNGFKYGDGIIGGAKWIAKNYYNNGQKTLEDMRHDPSGNGNNYATDPNWDNKIANIMKGSESYTRGETSSKDRSTTNNSNVNVVVNATNTPKDIAEKTGKAVRDSAKKALEDNLKYYSMEMNRS